jgi:hypothetical protein
MRNLLAKYIPVSILFAFLAIILVTCGGDGGGGLSSNNEIQPAPPPPAATLTGLSIDGPSSMPEYGTATYAATASWSDGSTTSVTPTWSVSFQDAEITSDGVLWCHSIGSDQLVTITATYSSETATKEMTIIRVPPIPFTAEELSGKGFFEENVGEGGGYDSHLYILNADFSIEQYSYEDPPGTSTYVTGTGSNSVYSLVLDVGGQELHVQRIAESSTEMEILIYEGPGPPSIVTWEKIVPVDPAKLPGTYAGSDGYTWVFNANGTGTVSIFGGIIFTWSVDANGVLRMPSSTGYTMSFYARATSQSTATEYTVLKAAFPEHNTSTGSFYAYYGGIELTRQ